MRVPIETALGLLDQWRSAPRIITVNFVDKSFGFGANVQLMKSPTNELRFGLCPPVMGEPFEYFLIRLDGSEEWDEPDDPLGALDCVFKRPGEPDGLLNLRICPTSKDFDLELEPLEQ